MATTGEISRAGKSWGAQKHARTPAYTQSKVYPSPATFTHVALATKNEVQQRETGFFSLATEQCEACESGAARAKSKGVSTE